jgi:hypothetical protein
MNKKEVSDIMGLFIYLFLNMDVLNIFININIFRFKTRMYKNVFFLYRFMPCFII